MENLKRYRSRDLADVFGVYCAYCLEYISADELDMHHVLPAARVRDHFSTYHQQTKFNFAWTIPVHRYCHRLIQPESDACFTYLQNLLRRTPHFAQRDQNARWFHDIGFYWYAALIRLDTLYKLGDGLELSQGAKLREFLIASAAGIQGSPNIQYLVRPKDFRTMHPGVLLQVANLQSCRGNIHEARNCLAQAEEQVDSFRGMKNQLDPSLKMRVAQITRNTASATDAWSAAESAYSRNTAVLISGNIAVENNTFEAVEESIEKLLGTGSQLSWLYRAETLFMQANLAIAQKNNACEIYSLLFESQYICALLGLQMGPHKVHLGCDHVIWDWAPGDALVKYMRSLPQRKRLTESDCSAMRKEVNARDFIFDSIFDTLKGQRSAPAVPKREN